MDDETRERIREHALANPPLCKYCRKEMETYGDLHGDRDKPLFRCPDDCTEATLLDRLARLEEDALGDDHGLPAAFDLINDLIDTQVSLMNRIAELEGETE